MKQFIVILILPLTALANVDMVMGDTTQDELIIGWSLENSVFVGKYSGGVYSDVIQHTDRNAVAVTMAADNNDGEHILLLPYVRDEFGVPVQICIYSYEDLTLESYCAVPSNQMHDRFGFLKAEDPRWDALLGYSNIAFASSVTEIFALQIYFEIHGDGDLIPLGSSQWQKDYYWPPECVDQLEYPGVMVGPVISPGGFPLTAISFGYNGSTSGWLMNHSLLFHPDSSELQSYTIGEFWDPVDSGVIGLGSSSDTGAILLFADSLGATKLSYFTTLQPDPESTALLPWAFPNHDDPVAFTSDNALPGTLMVWYRDGEIRCRHWNDQWNNYDYFVAYSPLPPSQGEIAVCTDTNGYWVAWLPVTESEPLVAFIDFGSVTGLSEHSSAALDPVVSLRLVANPVSGPLSVEVLGVESGQISVFDLYGRIVLRAEVSEEGLYQLDELAIPGVYLIRLSCPIGGVTAKVISIR